MEILDYKRFELEVGVGVVWTVGYFGRSGKREAFNVWVVIEDGEGKFPGIDVYTMQRRQTEKALYNCLKIFCHPKEYPLVKRKVSNAGNIVGSSFSGASSSPDGLLSSSDESS